MNSARRDLCGGYPVTGIPTATVLMGEKIKKGCGYQFSWQPQVSTITVLTQIGDSPCCTEIGTYTIED